MKHSFDRTYHWGIIIGMIFAGLVLVGGIALSFMGFAGTMQLIAEGPGFEVKIKNATPGIGSIALGAFLMVKLKPRSVEHHIITSSPSGYRSETYTRRSEHRGS